MVIFLTELVTWPRRHEAAAVQIFRYIYFRQESVWLALNTHATCCAYSVGRYYRVAAKPGHEFKRTMFSRRHGDVHEMNVMLEAGAMRRRTTPAAHWLVLL